MKKIWEFKVEDQRNNAVITRFHYFNAESYEQAEMFHYEVISRHGNNCQLISVTRKCPYSNKWFSRDQDAFVNFDK